MAAELPFFCLHGSFACFLTNCGFHTLLLCVKPSGGLDLPLAPAAAVRKHGLQDKRPPPRGGASGEAQAAACEGKRIYIPCSVSRYPTRACVSPGEAKPASRPKHGSAGRVGAGAERVGGSARQARGRHDTPRLPSVFPPTGSRHFPQHFSARVLGCRLRKNSDHTDPSSPSAIEQQTASGSIRLGTLVSRRFLRHLRARRQRRRCSGVRARAPPPLLG